MSTDSDRFGATCYPDGDSAPRVLLIDDEIRATDALVVSLVAEGFRIECVHDGIEGQRCAILTQPDVIILDLHLPDVLGLTIISELRRQHLATPVLVWTGWYLDTDHEAAAAALGAVAFLRKPIDADDLVKALRRAMSAPPPVVTAPVPVEPSSPSGRLAGPCVFAGTRSTPQAPTGE